MFNGRMIGDINFPLSVKKDKKTISEKVDGVTFISTNDLFPLSLSHADMASFQQSQIMISIDRVICFNLRCYPISLLLSAEC